MSLPLKQLYVCYGERYCLCTCVVLSGVGKDQDLTPSLARRAARSAAGHTRGVKVWSTEPYGYQLNGINCCKIEYVYRVVHTIEDARRQSTHTEYHCPRHGWVKGEFCKKCRR